MRMLYKYPQAESPYGRLLEENRRRGIGGPEFEIADSGVFEDGRYFDVTIEYAKAAADDILMRLTVENRSVEPAELHLLPQLWSRNTWSWREGAKRPLLRALPSGEVHVEHPALPPMRLSSDGPGPLLFCGNETNTRRLYGSNAPRSFQA